MPTTPADPPPTLNLAGQILRTMRLAAHFLIFIAVFLSFPLHRKHLPQLSAWWERRLLRLLGFRINLIGELPPHGTLLVANHVSWLDIVLLGGWMQAAFVSKAEVRNWPLIGKFAALLGTVFLARGKFKTADATRQVDETLGNGQPVVLFPGATTVADLLPPRFHARMFAAAVEGGHPIQPVAIHYLPPQATADRHHPWAPWTDEQGLASHFLRLCKLRSMQVNVNLCDPINPEGRDRRQLAQASHEAITRALQNSRQAP